MSTTLYRKYRPQTWAEVSGQNHVKATLAFEIETGRIAHAYLFSGPRGIGKTTIARIFAKSINCLDRPKGSGEPCGKCESCLALAGGQTLDVIEIDAASHRGIDAVRENIIENARFSPARLKYKVFIIDEVHMLTTEAFNALLKTLEEPPSHVIFILATTELHKVPPTIVSRCQRFDFRRIPFADLVERLHRLAEREKVKVDARTLEEIGRHADGSLRDAEGLLGKVLTVGDGRRVSYDEALVVLPRSDFAHVAAFVESLLRRDARAAVLTLDECLESGADIDQFAGETVELLRKTLLAKLTGDPEVFAFDLDEARQKKLIELKNLADVPQLVGAIEKLLEKRRDFKTSRPPQLPLELAAAEICEGLPPTAILPPAPACPPSPPAPVGPPTSRPIKSKPAATSSPPTKPENKYPLSEPASIAGESKGRSTAESIASLTAPAVTLEQIRAIWSEFIRRAGEQNHSLTFLLGVGTPREVCADVVRIGFNYEFHKNKMNEAKNRMIMEDVLGSLLGQPLRLEGMVLDKIPEVGQNDAAGSAPAPVVPVGSAEALAAAFGGRVVE